MTYVVALQGNPTVKYVHGDKKLVTPFVGTNQEGAIAMLGVGILHHDHDFAEVWGLVSPHYLIQSWRGMKILEALDEIDQGTLAACFYVCRQEYRLSDAEYYDKLSASLGVEKFNALRARVLASSPSAKELNAMIHTLRKNGVSISLTELEDEVAAGRISVLPIFDKMRAEHSELEKRRQEIECEIARQMPPGESLDGFFISIGVKNIIEGSPSGAYGLDWSTIEPGNLDRVVKATSLHNFEKFALWRTTQNVQTVAAKAGLGITAYTAQYGSFEQPWVVGTSRTKYTFIEVGYSDNCFFITTKVEIGEGVASYHNYSIAQLRELIGPVMSTAYMPPLSAEGLGTKARACLSKAAALFRR